MRFEYKLVPVVGAQSTGELNDAGSQGWEAVGLAPLADGIVALLKKAVDTPTVAPPAQLTAAAFAVAAQPPTPAPSNGAVVDTGTAEPDPACEVKTVAHPQWATWLAGAADGDADMVSVVASFWELYESSGFDRDPQVISDLAVTACRLQGVPVPDFANV